MSLTLGEKLRQAREERGFTLSEVAEQTRISSLYLEHIEKDDYKILPGGIFNKGFVKSFAKFVGINEQEALADYTRMIAQTESNADELKVYRPEVLTDDRSAASMAPTIIIAVIILALMTAGILFLLNYLRQPTDDFSADSKITNTNTPANAVDEPPAETHSVAVPEMSSLRVEFKALTDPVSLSATTDGKFSTNVVTAGSAALFEPKESLKLSYSRSLANAVELSLNGRIITLPSQPLIPRRNTIEFEINKENIARIWESGAISTEVPGAKPQSSPTSAAVSAIPAATPPATPARPTATPAANANANRPNPRPTTPVETSPSPPPTAKTSPQDDSEG